MTKSYVSCWLFSSFHLECRLLVLPVLKNSQRFSSAWRYASLRRLILQTKLNGFPLEGLWLIPDAYSILCGHCSRKFPPDRTKRTTKATLLYEIVSSIPCAQIFKAVKFVTVMAFMQWGVNHWRCLTKKPYTGKTKWNKADCKLAAELPS